jgi:hypothetical protein
VDYDLYYYCVGLSIFFIFGLKPGLLIEDATFKAVLAISSMIFVVGLALHFTAEASDSARGALLAPLLTLGYFRLLRKLFLRWVHREPIDTAFNWTPGLVKDRTFAFAFVFGSILITFVTIFGMERLAKAGW